MTVLIDPPAWSAHGTLWSHLVSDFSLAELHAFAARLGLDRRAFDLDHYDIAASDYQAALHAGARHAGARELARRLARSGLRVPGRDRAALRTVRHRWIAMMPGAYAPGDDLLVRWREPHRAYHNVRHLTECLDAADLLVDTLPQAHRESTTRIVQLALWFHDAVYTGVAGHDEAASADLARCTLAAHPVPGERDPQRTAEQVAHLVALTAHHDPGPHDRMAGIVCDADLAILAADADRYTEYTQEVRAEYPSITDAAFREGRAAVLERLLGRTNLYQTPYARAHWLARARANVTRELTLLGH